jgi:DNA invertase Pin-like site-specific DNA recombinase
LEFNGEFHYPLDSREVWWISKSVAKWVWRNFSESGRSEWAANKGRAGGKASGVVRAKANEDKRASARLMRASGLTLEAIAIELEVGKRTVKTWLDDLCL